MSQRTRAWQLLATVALALGCNPSPSADPIEDAVCSNETKCPTGYKCTNNPGDPLSTGKCEYQESA